MASGAQIETFCDGSARKADVDRLILLLYFRGRRRRGKLALKHREIRARQIAYRKVSEIPVAPASDIIAGDGLLRNGLAGPQRREADGMRRMLVDDGRHRTIVDDIDPAAQERKALCREVRHLRRFRQPRREPRLDRVTIGGCYIERLRRQQTPDMAG